MLHRVLRSTRRRTAPRPAMMLSAIGLLSVLSTLPSGASHAAPVDARARTSTEAPARTRLGEPGDARGDLPAGARAERARRWVDQGIAHYQAGRVDSAQTLWLRAGRAGDRLGAYNAAVLRINGESTWPRLGEALRLLERSATDGLAAASLMLATLHDERRIPDSRLEQAAFWYRKAAEAGDVDAQRALAGLHLLGRGVPADDREAARWYERAAEAGDLTAQYVIASFLEKGHGVTADLERALQWYAAAARQGDRVADLKAKEIAARLARERAAQ